VTNAIHVHAWQGEGAVTLAVGDYTTTWLPSCGMLGVSLTHRGHELIALPRSITEYRRGMPRGGYTGLPLNAPYANRLAQRRFEIDGRAVEIPRSAANDRNGLPIHGTLEAQPFRVELIDSESSGARIIAHFRHDDSRLLEAFPFEHEYNVDVELTVRGLTVSTTVRTDERVSVPVSFGWHPFLRVPATPRSRWRLRLPDRTHAILDERLLPTGRTVHEAVDDRVIGRRTFDDHYRLGRDRRFTLTGSDRSVDIRFDTGYRYAQVFLPPADAVGWSTTDFVCIEPMVAPINALIEGGYPTATRDTPFTASFAIAARATKPA
jgi:aldose 1-epimerase